MSVFRIGTAAVAALLAAGHAGAGNEPASGSFRLFAHFERDRAVIEQNGVTISAGSSHGIAVVFDGTAEPLRSGVFDADTVFLSRREGDRLSLEGYSLRRDADGDEWYSRLKRVSGTQEQGTRGEGRYELLGGTGKYRGLTGSCTYGVSNLSGDAGVTLAECEWQIDPDSR